MEVSSLELAGFIFGVIGVWLTIKENIYCFPIGLINVTISLVLFYEQKLYSDVIQQGVYIILLIYGWNSWIKGNNKSDLIVSKAGINLLIPLFVAGAILTFSMGMIFSSYTDADVPYIDAAATSASFIAQFLIAKKKIENWILWIIVNCTYISVYIYKDLWLYAILFTIYLVMAVIGYKKWKKQLIKKKPLFN
jgi:nicotinamide mononucleotide transporter